MSAFRVRGGGRRGQSAGELAITLGLLVLAILAMSTYVQRGLQGGLYAATSSIGQQFDPTQNWSESQGMSSTDTDHATVMSGAVTAHILEGDLIGQPNPQVGMPNLPTAWIHREPAVLKEREVTASWSTNGSASYCTGSGC